MKNLPIGVQTFQKMREKDYIYVDKTQFIYAIAEENSNGNYFLSRPRRFGKSLMVNTLKELFSGNEPLFQGLWIHDKWDWSKTFPVIHLSFDAMDYRDLGLDKEISYAMKKWAEKYQITLTTRSYKKQFEELLEKLYAKKGKVVLLIDEYDKPIIDYLEKGELLEALKNQKIMKNFYSVLKSSEQYLRFFFVTGISKFSRVSMFSDLNHITDLTMHPTFTTALGYTHQELELYFEEHLQAAQETLEMSRETLLEEMRIQYNGYSWDGVTRLYNPFGILNFFDQKWLLNFWFVSGMPSFLLKTMKEKLVFDVENSKINMVDLEKYDIESLELIPLLFQTGYLTVKSIDRETREMVLDYPNKEVRESLYTYMIDGLAKNEHRSGASITNKDLLIAFQAADLARVKALLNALLAGLPSEAYDKKSEGLYHGLIHFIFQLLGMSIKSEVHSAKGRADSVVETATHVFIFEFKFNRSAEEAVTQIKDRKYADKYRADNKTIIGIGVNFDSIEKEIKGWETEIL